MGYVTGKIIPGILIALGLILFALGFAVKFAIFPAVLQDQIYANLDLSEGTEGYDAFVEPPVPVYMSFRFFNVTNPEEIKKGMLLCPAPSVRILIYY